MDSDNLQKSNCNVRRGTSFFPACCFRRAARANGGVIRGWGREKELRRAIVIHCANFVSERTIAALGRLGRSQGCPALDHEVAGRVIQLIRDGTALYAYHPSAARESSLAAR